MLGLAGALGVTQLGVWLLARGLRQRLPGWVMAAGFLLPFAFLAPWLDGHRLLVPCNILSAPIPGAPYLAEPDPHGLLNDAIYQFLPWELEVRHALAERRLPFWSDLLEGGSSPWANPQAGVLSPLQIPARFLPIQHHLLAALALKILVAFEGAWLLARRLGASRFAGVLAGAGFALGGGLLAWAIFPHTAAAAWIPWLTVGVIGLFRRPDGRTIAAAAVLTAFLLLSGHPEVAAGGGLFAAVCGLSLRRRRAPFRRSFGAAALAAVLGAGLAAPHLLPFLRLLPDSQRAHETLALSLPSWEVRLAEPLTWFVPGHGPFMLSATNPHAFGRPFQDAFRGPINWVDAESGYTGLLAFAGAWVVLLAFRCRRAWPLLAFALVSFLLAARFLPLAELTFAIPPLRVPAYARLLLVACLALSVSGALGIDHLLRRRGRSGWAWAALGLAAAISLGVARDPQVWTLWALLAGGALLAVFWKPGARLLFLAVLLLDLGPWGRSLLPSGRPELFYPRTPFLDDVAKEVQGGEYRAVGGDFLVYASLLPVYGIAEIRPHNPLAPMAFVQSLGEAFDFRPSMTQYFAHFHNLDHPLLDFLNVRALVSSVALAPPRTLELADGGRYAPFFLYRNPDALPRWFLPSAVEAVPGREMGRWIREMRDPGRVAVLSEERDARGAESVTPGWRPVRIQALSPGRLTIGLPPAGETVLASSIPFQKGWRAEAGAKQLAVIRVNGAFLGVRVPAGTKSVSLRFVPPGFWAGITAWALSLGAVAFVARRRPSRRRE